MKKRLPSLLLAAALSVSLFPKAQAAELPARFDLRDENLVSSVKLQSPWNTCWGFGAIAAAEISILASLRALFPEMAARLADPNQIDLSEMQLAWFATNPIPQDGMSGQGGEGVWVEGAYPLDAGGNSVLAASVFAAGTGPIYEYEAPYRNSEGVTMNQCEDSFVYADVHPEDPSRYYDWSVSDSLRNQYAFELEEAFLLPSPAGSNLLGKYFYNPEGTRAIKEQLLLRRGVSVVLATDSHLAGFVAEQPRYINSDGGTWAHYAWNEDGRKLSASHVVCIVGWDDNYSRDNFLPGHKPPADGAWIVKNSWGAINNESPNKAYWGVDGSGYFYVSYYDMSISDPECFVFDVARTVVDEADYIFVEQYDLMPTMDRWTLGFPRGSNYKMANTFVAEDDLIARTVGIQTMEPNVTVTVNVYVLQTGTANPEDGRRVSTVSRAFPTAGYHRITLPQPIDLPKGTWHSVVVSEQTEDGGSQLPLTAGLSTVRGFSGGLIHYSAKVNPGESFLFDGTVWSDWSVSRHEIARIADPVGSGLVLDNHSIKVYADPKHPQDLSELKQVSLLPTQLPTDVNDGEWYAGAVQNVMGNHLLNALNGAFTPDAIVSREDLEQAVRGLGSQLPAAITGPITREDCILALFEAAKEKGLVRGIDLSVLDAFPDGETVSKDAREALAWMVKQGVLCGMGDGTLSPQLTATRSQLAVFLSRYLQLLGQ